MPAVVRTLDEFGYSDDEIASTATRVAATSAFRVLSAEGAAVMLDIARRLERFAQANPRIDERCAAAATGLVGSGTCVSRRR